MPRRAIAIVILTTAFALLAGGARADAPELPDTEPPSLPPRLREMLRRFESLGPFPEASRCWAPVEDLSCFCLANPDMERCETTSRTVPADPSR